MKRMRNRVVVLFIVMMALGLFSCSKGGKTEKIDLNSVSLDTIIKKAKEEGRVDSVGMPDSWADWGDTWAGIKAKYGIDHTDTDMSSAEELSVFESEKASATKDIGDVGQAFGPIAVEKGLANAYKTSYWNEIPDWAKDADGRWIIAYYGTISILANKKLVANAPHSFKDILDGNYKVNVGDVSAASQAQFSVLATALALGGNEKNLKPAYDFYKKLAEAGRLDLGDSNLARIEKGEIAVALLWDYNSLGYRDQIKANNPDSDYEVHIPSEASVQSGYCTILNAYSKHPYAAALAREYILSDEGQINLAKGYAKPVRKVNLPSDLAQKLIPDAEYVKANAHMVSDINAWKETCKTIGSEWQEEVVAYAKQ
jgi:putative spermidine/putrescine transport system substrate-binding protein